MNSVASITIPRAARSVLLPAAVVTGAFALAVVGALLVKDSAGVDEVNLFVETLAGRSGSYFGGLGILAPLGFAFAAGVAAAFNPCGFAMLPAYMGLYLGADEKNQAGRLRLPKQVGRALLVGGTVTLGFTLLFAAAGAIIDLGARSIVSSVLPWLGLAIGVVLTLAGAWVLGGGKLYSSLAQQAAARIGDPGQSNIRGYFLFGVSYGTASLSCTLPIFLSVAGLTFTSANIATSFAQFVLYALGMGLVITSLTVGMALFKGTMVKGMRKAMPYIQPVGMWLMIVAGTYIVFYWLSIGELLG